MFSSLLFSWRLFVASNAFNFSRSSNNDITGVKVSFFDGHTLFPVKWSMGGHSGQLVIKQSGSRQYLPNGKIRLGTQQRSGALGLQRTGFIEDPLRIPDIRLQVELSLIVNSGTGKGMDTNTSWAKEPVLADRDVTEVDGLACQCSNQTSWVTQLCFEVTNPRGGHYR